jgi:hypothetical protein
MHSFHLSLPQPSDEVVQDQDLSTSKLQITAQMDRGTETRNENGIKASFINNEGGAPEPKWSLF